jgi:outer membrane protein, multidrug efflux system
MPLALGRRFRASSVRFLVPIFLSSLGRVAFSEELPAPPNGAVGPGPAKVAEPSALAPSETTVRPVVISDPLLSPIEKAPKTIRRWREALTLLRANSIDLGQAEQNVRQARARSSEALSRILPTLTASSQLQHHLLTGQAVDSNGNIITLPNPQTIFGASASLNVPIVDLLAWHDIKTANLDIRRLEQNQLDRERLVIVGLADALIGVVTSERLAEVSRLSLASALENLELTTRRSTLGVGLTLDVLRAEQEVARSRGQVVEANESLARARDALGLALGLTDPVGVENDLHLDELQVDARATCRRQSNVDARADMLAAAAASAVAQRQVSRIYKTFAPTLSAGSTLSYNAFSRFSPNGDNTTWTIGAVLSWNLYDGGVRYAQKRLRAAEYENTELTRIGLRRKIEVEIRQAERLMDVAKNSLQIVTARRDSARKAARLAQFKFTSGNGSAFDLVTALQTMREAELDVTVKEFELVKSEVAAFLALASCDI